MGRARRPAAAAVAGDLHRQAAMAQRSRRFLKITGLVVVGGLALIQVIPYGRDHDNPPVVSEPRWDSDQTRALAVRACFACHSNETRWPWYSHVAPFSWFVQHHVDDGREHLNFSDWAASAEEADELEEVITSGEMPLRSYTLLHADGRLTDAEQQALIDGLRATVARTGGDATASGEAGERGHDD